MIISKTIEEFALKGGRITMDRERGEIRIWCEASAFPNDPERYLVGRFQDFFSRWLADVERHDPDPENFTLPMAVVNLGVDNRTTLQQLLSREPVA